MARLEKLYVTIATVLVVFSVFFFVAQEQESRNFDDFALLKQRALHLYDDIISFARNSDQNDRLTVLIDENTQIQNNRIITQNPETGEQESYELNLFVQGTSCVGENEIVRLTEGIALCCGQCDNDVRLQFPNDVMCSPRQDVWLSCTNFPRGTLGRVSLLCENVSGSSATLLNDQNEIVATVSNPTAQWEDYLIFSFNQQVDVGDYVLELHCGADPTFQQLRVRIPSAGGGGGGGSRAPRNDSFIPPASAPQCNDGSDNDNDGRVDYPFDAGCRSASDNNEVDDPFCGLGWSINENQPGSFDLSHYPALQQNYVYQFGLHQIGLLPYFAWGTSNAINGGIPQAGNLAAHLAQAQIDIQNKIPQGFDGFVMLDFEHIPPIWNLTTDTVKNASIAWTLANTPGASSMTEAELNATAIVQYESGMKEYYLQTIQLGQELRPDAKWGVYPWPHGNYHLLPSSVTSFCPNPTYDVGLNDCYRSLNDRFLWLFNVSDVLFPDFYQYYYVNMTGGTAPVSPQLNLRQIESELNESLRVSSLVGGRYIMPFVWPRYHDAAPAWYRLTFLNPISLNQTFYGIMSRGADGLVIWGYEASPSAFAEMQGYINDTLGPLSTAWYNQFCGPTQGSLTAPVYACSDTLDNDGDGAVDLFDEDCMNGRDNNEASPSTECHNGMDDDGDGLVDWPIDPGCTAYDDDESGDPASSSDDLIAFSWWPMGLVRDNLIKMYVIGETQTLGPNGRVSYMAPDPVDAANAMLARSDPRHRVLKDRDTSAMYDGGLIDPLIGNTSDACTDSAGGRFECRVWFNNSIPIVQQRYRDFFDDFVAAGGTASMMVLDLEGIGGGNWFIGSNVSRWDAIQNDPRFVEEGLPQKLASIGITDIRVLAAPFSEPGRSQYQNWNGFMHERSARILRDATYDVVKDYFPAIRFSNYGYGEMNSTKYGLPDGDGHAAPTSVYDGTWGSAGNYQAPNIYGCYRQITYRSNALPDVRYYAASGFNALRWEVNNMRASLLSSDRPMTPWIATRDSLGANDFCWLQNTDWYQESLLHASLQNVEAFLYWNAYSSTSSMSAQDTFVSNTLDEFDRIAGYDGRTSLISDNGNSNVYESNELINWSSDYVLTGMESAGRIVWRFSPNMRSFDDIADMIITNNTDPIAGATIVRSQKYVITFPQGMLHFASSPVSGFGLWIVQPQGAPSPFVSEVLDSCVSDSDDNAQEDSTGDYCVRQCYDGIDNDGDSAIDASDFSCFAQGHLENSVLAQCQDGIDNDGDGRTDYLQEGSACTPLNILGYYAHMDNSENIPPVANFTASPITGARPLTVHFDASGSYDNESTALSYVWSFGPSGAQTTTTSPTTQYTYVSGGFYTATLTVIDEYGENRSVSINNIRVT